MEIVHYLRVLRRRWRVLLACSLVGVLVGVASTAIGGQEKAQVSFYLAKHTLQSTGGAVNLDRAAALVTEGEVPRRAAAKLGEASPQVLASRVKAEPRPEVGFLYIAATGTDPQRSVQIADTFAEELVAYLDEQQRKADDASITRLTQRLADLEKEITDLDGQVKAARQSGVTSQADVLELQLADKRTEYNDILGQVRDARSNPTSSANGRLVTLSTAEAVPISGSALAKLLAADTTARSGAGGVSQARASQIDQAISGNPTRSAPLRAGLGGVVGLLLGIAFVLIFERIDPRIRTKEDAESAFGWPVIGEIPPLTRREQYESRVLAYDEPRSRAAEAFRVVRSALLLAGDGHVEADPTEHPLFADAHGDEPGDLRPADPPGADAASTPTGQVIMVTSPGPSEGKTTTTSNLAAILAETGRSVLVINCDFRRPRLHSYLGTEVVARQVLPTRIPGVSIVPQVTDHADDANPAEVVAAQRKIIRNARRLYDLVVLDTAPLLTTNDATEVLSAADQVVIVARSGRTNRDAADRAAELLERRQAVVTGVILVGATDVPTARYYYYTDNPGKLDEPIPGEEDGTPLDELVAVGAHGAHADETGDARPDPSVAPSPASSASAEPANVDVDGGAADLNPLDLLAAPETPRRRRRSRERSED